MVRKLGAGPGGGVGRHRLGQIEHVGRRRGRLGRRLGRDLRRRRRGRRAWRRYRPDYWRRPVAAAARRAGRRWRGRLGTAAAGGGAGFGGQLGRLGGLAGIVVGNDAPDGGQDFLHRGLLGLRRLGHCREFPTAVLTSRTGLRPTVTRLSESLQAPFIRQWDASVAVGKRRNRNELWTREARRRRFSAQRPSGVRTPAQLSRTCW